MREQRVRSHANIPLYRAYCGLLDGNWYYGAKRSATASPNLTQPAFVLLSSEE